MSGPARGLWIEMTEDYLTVTALWSGPARGLWIEIYSSNHAALYRARVGPREGPVD